MAEGKAWKLIALNSFSKLEKGIITREDAYDYFEVNALTEKFVLDTINLTGLRKKHKWSSPYL